MNRAFSFAEADVEVCITRIIEAIDEGLVSANVCHSGLARGDDDLKGIIFEEDNQKLYGEGNQVLTTSPP